MLIFSTNFGTKAQYKVCFLLSRYCCMSDITEKFTIKNHTKDNKLTKIKIPIPNGQKPQKQALEHKTSQEILETAIDDHRLGHRERLKAKFLNSEFQGFHDYEIIELVLFNAIPRRDVKPLAKTLIKEFGTVESIFAAPKKEILNITGCGENVYYILKLFSKIGCLISREQLNQAPLLSKWSELSSYLRLKIGYLTHEEFHVLFLNAKSYLIKDLKLFRGTVDKSAVYPREIIKHALECGAAGIVLAHNHPSGDATPSMSDVEVTKHITKAAEIINISIIDHIIVGKYDIKSFRNLNLL